MISVLSVVTTLVVATSVSHAEDNRDKLIPEYMALGMDCMKDQMLDMETCKEMLKDGNDNSDEKYTPCKCVPTCVAKKRGSMKENGEFDIQKFTENVDEFGHQPWSDEWRAVLEKCKDSFKGLLNCEASAAFGTCAYKNSQMLRDEVSKYLGQVE